MTGKPLKIGITCHPTVGGSGILASELGKYLANRGHSVHFITMSVPYRLREEYHENLFFHTVDVQPYPLFENTPYNMALAAKMREVAEEQALDLLHVHYAIPHSISAYLAAQMLLPRKLPIVTTLHGTDITLVGQDKSFFELTRFGIEKSTVVTAVSDSLKQDTQNVFNPKIEIRRIHNFVDVHSFGRRHGPCHRDVFAKDEQIVYMHNSNFRAVKRVEDVVKVFARTVQSVDGVLVMIGEGPSLRTARDLAQSLGVMDRVRFLGNQMDVAGLMGCGDVFLFPSETESFGLAPLEAMASEMPVIASNSGGIPEVVTHGESGFLAAVGDIETMAHYAVELGRSPELRARMGRAGRVRAETVFPASKAADEYEQAYRDAIALSSL